jgi:hypothetical protein
MLVERFGGNSWFKFFKSSEFVSEVVELVEHGGGFLPSLHQNVCPSLGTLLDFEEKVLSI